MMKKFWFTAISLMLTIVCMASALAESTMFATPLSLKDKIQKAKDRSYLNDGVDNRIIRNSKKSSGTQLPSVLEMDGADDFSISEKKNYDTYCKIVFTAYDPDKLDFANEYVDILVEEHGYRIIHDENRKSTGYRHTVWYMEHPDSGVESSDIYEDNGLECDVLIVLNQYFEDGDCTLAVYHVSDLTHADAGDASSDDGGSRSSSSKRCSNCGGDGRCNTCGGSGQVWTWAGDMYAYVRCTAFGCSGGRCAKCS